MGKILWGGKVTKLRAGDCITFYIDSSCLKFSRDDLNPRNTNQLTWSNGDDKRIVSFIGNEHDLWEFADILAQTHGLRAVKRKVAGRNWGYAFVA